MKAITSNDISKIAHLFKNETDTLILSGLQFCHPCLFISNDSYSAVKLYIADFCFIAGDIESCEADELILYRNENPKHNLHFLIPSTERWSERVKSLYGEKANAFKRYALSKTVNKFNLEKLETYTKELPTGYELKPIDENIYPETFKHKFSSDFCSNFNSVEDYLNRGMGFVVTHNGKIVAGASSYTVYSGNNGCCYNYLLNTDYRSCDGIEIEIATSPEHQRKGLATAVGSAIILKCIKNGIYPSWDAANLTSVKLAEKLGYIFTHEYDTYAITV